MAIINKLVLVTLNCLRCKHQWHPKQKDVRICPKCKSPYWDRKKIEKKG